MNRSINPVDDRVFIGDSTASGNEEWLARKGITHVVNCTYEIPNSFKGKLHYLQLHMRDETRESLERVLEPSYEYIEKVLRRNPHNKVFIHCHMGMSRSASIALYYLHRRYGLTYAEAYQYLKRRRPIVQPNTGYERQLKRIMVR